MKQENHYHYEITGYSLIKDERLLDICSISVYAKNEDEAIKRAKDMVVKKYYRVNKSWECTQDHGLQLEMQMAQLEMQKKIFDFMKGAHHS